MQKLFCLKLMPPYMDTNDSPQSQKYDALQALSTEEVEKMVIENENKFTDKIKINIGDETIPLSLNVDTFQEINDEFQEIQL